MPKLPLVAFERRRVTSFSPSVASCNAPCCFVDLERRFRHANDLAGEIHDSLEKLVLLALLDQQSAKPFDAPFADLFGLPLRFRRG